MNFLIFSRKKVQPTNLLLSKQNEGSLKRDISVLRLPLCLFEGDPIKQPIALRNALGNEIQEQIQEQPGQNSRLLSEMLLEMKSKSRSKSNPCKRPWKGKTGAIARVKVCKRRIALEAPLEEKNRGGCKGCSTICSCCARYKSILLSASKTPVFTRSMF